MYLTMFLITRTKGKSSNFWMTYSMRELQILILRIFLYIYKKDIYNLIQNSISIFKCGCIEKWLLFVSSSIPLETAAIFEL